MLIDALAVDICLSSLTWTSDVQYLLSRHDSRKQVRRKSCEQGMCRAGGTKARHHVPHPGPKEDRQLWGRSGADPPSDSDLSLCCLLFPCILSVLFDNVEELYIDAGRCMHLIPGSEKCNQKSSSSSSSLASGEVSKDMSWPCKGFL
jgi:hypothetical protein